VIFVGDVHGAFEYLPKYKRFTQVGDLGIGFGQDESVLDKIDFQFIRGNHDNPEKCQEHPSFIGDWKVEGHVLYLSGAGSIDKFNRIWGVDWWPNEELTHSQMNEVLDLPDDLEIKVVVAHDCPHAAYPEVLSHHSMDSFTTPKFLDHVLVKFNPRIWIHGHHHKSKTYRVRSTQFYSLGIAEQKEIDIT
jgi:Icc-related predicted phosphoesterase